MALSNRRQITAATLGRELTYADHQCSEKVLHAKSFRSTLCARQARVMYDESYETTEQVAEKVEHGEWEGLTVKVDKTLTKTRVVRFCPTHDPEAINAREAKRRREWDEERARGKRLEETMRALISRLHVGTVDYEPGRGVTGYIKLSGDDARKLLTELGR